MTDTQLTESINELCRLLKNYTDRHYPNSPDPILYIELYTDGSGSVNIDEDNELFEFTNPNELIYKLLNE